MDKKALTNLIKNVLTFLVIFLLVQAAFNWFYHPSTKKTPINTQIELIATKNNFHLHDIVQIKLENNSANPVTFKNLCPTPSLSIEKQNNGKWEPVTSSEKEKINCYGQPKFYTVAPHQTFTIPLKDWNHALFGNIGNYQAKLALNNGKILHSNSFQISGQTFFGWIWITLLYQPITNALIYLTSIIPNHDFGWAIILLTILIRTLLLVPNQKALHSQKKLQIIQPKLNQLKEKHKGDQQKIAAETMSLYKEHKVNPLGSCLPMLIQIPILLGLYEVIQSGLSPNNTFLLYGSLKNFDINLVHTNFLGILELTKINYTFLPIIVGVLQFLQIRLSLGQSKNQSGNQMTAMNKGMTIIMPIMITIFAASVPSGVGLYWASSTLYATIQQIFVNRSHDQDHTQIKLADGSKNKLKKKEYQKKTAARNAIKVNLPQSDIIEATPEQTVLKQIDNEKTQNEDDDQNPPIKIIKA